MSNSRSVGRSLLELLVHLLILVQVQGDGLG
jgi:hypothetical protein